VKSLDGSFSDTRRVLRLGKILQVYQTLRLIPEKFRGNPTQLFLETGKAVSSGAYMLNDHGKWIAANHVLEIDGEKYGYRATCAWFSTIVFSLILDFIKLYSSFIAERDLRLKLHTFETQVTTEGSEKEEKSTTQNELRELYIARRFIYIEIAKNVFDTPIAIVGVMKWKNVISTGILSLCGIISSSLAVYATWKKIVPWT